ncbi:MAG: energy-coupling factor transporter ATPase [Firmicutes bacterium]|nr:energy-coupling factor transporter ATPase [Bacillota bacterium]
MPIKIENLTHIYMKDTVFEQIALDDVSISINDGEFIGLIGHTGSGKSTLIQHLNVLLKPTSGRILLDDIDINTKGVPLKSVRQKVGLVFQYPEHQLFEETVYKDIAFGPKNLGLDDKQIEKRVKTSLELVGLDYEDFKDASPFDLSGGQKRRIAIAGVIAMKPKVLILDEPTAGLDPKGRDEILSYIKTLQNREKITVILVSHSMEDIAKLVDKIIVMSKGKIIYTDTPDNVFKEIEMLEDVGLGVPQVSYLMRELRKKGFQIEDSISVEDAKNMILKVLRGRKNA